VGRTDWAGERGLVAGGWFAVPQPSLIAQDGEQNQLRKGSQPQREKILGLNLHATKFSNAGKAREGGNRLQTVIREGIHLPKEEISGKPGDEGGQHGRVKHERG